MRKLSPLAIVAFTVDLLLLGIGASHLPSVAERSKVPFEITERGNQVLVDGILDAKSAPDLKTADQVVSWNGEPIQVSEFLMFAADCDSVGSPVRLGYRRAGQDCSTTITLIPFYASARFVIVSGFVGLAFWLIGLFILFSRPNEHAGRVLHWSIILMGATLLLTQGRIVQGDFYSIFSRALFLLVYPLMGATFTYFSTLFPRPKLGSRAVKASVIFGPGILCASLLIVFFLRAVYGVNSVEFARFQFFYDACHVLLMVYGIGTIASMIHSYVVSRTKEEQRKLQWMMWGFAVGPTPFIVLIIIPQLLFSVDLVTEEYATLFLVVVPFTLAISFLKYQIMDIGVLINRSIVYSVLTVFIGAIYISVALLIASAFGGARMSDQYFFVVALSLLIAMLLNPLRIQVQRFVDATLFPARSRYREVVRELSGELHRMITTEELYRGIVHTVQRYLPVSAVAVYSHENGALTLQGIPPPGLVSKFHLSEEHAQEIALPRVFASSSAVNFHRNDIDTTKEHLLVRLGVSVGLPLVGESGQLLGMLVANPRAETKRFDEGEIDLLVTIGHQAEGALDRLKLQEKFFIEREGKRQAEELNALKSYFVSSVSHELRTPLTSIRMFGDTLMNQEVTSKRRRKEYLGIIVGEAERLGRLVNNILDFSKIEQGLKEFHFAKINFLEVVKKTVAAMKYQVTMDGGSLKVKTPLRLPFVVADGDALQEVIMNLLSNALKYSGAKKRILLTVRRDSNFIEFAVADNGLGIAESDLPHIFDQFFRVKDDRSRQVGGAGLGLTVVKHIVQAHHGTIAVTSKIGVGSTFLVRIPLNHGHENDPHR